MLNYALLNKRGFSTAKATRTKRVRPKGASSTPSSPGETLKQTALQLVKSCLNIVKEKKGAGVNAKLSKKGKENTLVPEKENNANCPSLNVGVNASMEISPKRINNVKESSNEVVVITESHNMAMLNLEGLSKEEKKRALVGVCNLGHFHL